MLSGEGALCINGIRAGVGTLLTCDTTELDLYAAQLHGRGPVVDAHTLRSGRACPIWPRCCAPTCCWA
jgi:hypothetical protein